MKTIGMKRIFIFSMICCLCVGVLYGNFVKQAYSQETLKITVDQFEFRDEPKAIEETLLGTLRIGTPVEWTGKTSGRWFEVKHPNGQVGWVHASGLSTPKTRVAPTPKPQKTTSRAVKKPTNQVAKLQATIDDLQKTSEFYKAQLDEKERQLSDLRKTKNELEEKMADTADMLKDSKHMETVEISKLESEIKDLKQVLEEKENLILTRKYEATQLNTQIDKPPLEDPSRDRFFLYAISVPLNIFALLLLVFMGIRRTRHKRQDEAQIESAIRQRHEEEISAEPALPKVASQQANQASSGPDESVRVHDARPGVEESEIVMDSSSSEDERLPVEEATGGDEEVVIDLADVLPIEHTGGYVTEAADIVAEEEAEQPEEISVEPLEPVEEIIDTSLVEPQLVHEEEAEAEIIEEGGEEIIEEIEEVEDELLLEEDVELLLEDELEVIPEEESELDKHLREEIEQTPEFSEDADLDELLEEGELEETLQEIGGEEVEEVPQKVEVGGETYEMLLASSTQIIELEEDEMLAEEEYVPERPKARAITGIQAQDAETEDTEAEQEYFAADLEEEQELEAEEMEGVQGESELSEDELMEELIGDNSYAEDMIGEIEIIEEMIEEGEELSEDELFEEIEVIEDVPEQFSEEEVPEDTAPLFLEPSPVLIEPEYEAEELLPEESVESVQEQVPSAEPTYDIELLDIADDKERILGILSKIQGLTKSPEKLVESTPCVILRGANESDAKNFEILMKKLGSHVRLIPK